jgi:hypothetical protein
MPNYLKHGHVSTTPADTTAVAIEKARENPNLEVLISPFTFVSRQLSATLPIRFPF